MSLGSHGQRGVALALKLLPYLVGGGDRAACLLPDFVAAEVPLVVQLVQRTLLARCARLPWHRVPVADRTCDRGHGRIEIRTLKAVSVNNFGFPHASQVLQVTRKTRPLHTNRWRTVTVYALTSLPFELARPARLADLLRGHWAIEALHHVRDVTFAEDASQVRTGAAPNAMAVLRNLVIGCSVGQGRSTSPPPCATTPATHADPWPPSGSAPDEPTSRQNDGALHPR
jgi:hypothetical protein